VAVLFVLPFLVVVLGAFSTSWSGSLPSGTTLANLTAVFTESETAGTIVASLVSAVVATVVSLILATAAAIATRSTPWLRRVMNTVMLLPVAVPSVVIGLAVLMAFSSPPLTINGTVVIVLLAHSIFVITVAYQPISAAVSRLNPAHEEAAAVLGASDARILRTVTLPALRPAIAAAAAMCVAMSMGELTVTMMVAPPSWRTMPLQIFSFTGRGIRLYEGAALALVLMGLTLLALVVLQRALSARSPRRRARPVPVS
jgi:2-aminoethylphosphonate transport system permease protein